jgi:hypothetical protein
MGGACAATHRPVRSSKPSPALLDRLSGRMLLLLAGPESGARDFRTQRSYAARTLPPYTPIASDAHPSNPDRADPSNLDRADTHDVVALRTRAQAHTLPSPPTPGFAHTHPQAHTPVMPFPSCTRPSPRLRTSSRTCLPPPHASPYRPLPKCPVAPALGARTLGMKRVFSRKQPKSAGARRFWKGSLGCILLHPRGAPRGL